MEIPPPGANPPPRQGLAVSSLILGILGNICFWPFTGIAAVITGHIALSRTRRDPAVYGGAGLAIAGLVFGYVSFLLGFVVMAVLAGLLLPALSKAKSKAQQIKCVNNLKQIGLAARMYSNDHADTFPTNFAALESYLGDASILICPADSQHVPLAVRDFNQLGPSNISYQFLLPGAKESDVTDQVVFLCPIHGNSGMGDGSVQQGRPR